MRFQNSSDRREWAEELLDIAMAAVGRILEAERKAAEQERLLRMTIDRKNSEIIALKRDAEEANK